MKQKTVNIIIVAVIAIILLAVIYHNVPLSMTPINFNDQQVLYNGSTLLVGGNSCTAFYRASLSNGLLLQTSATGQASGADQCTNSKASMEAVLDSIDLRGIDALYVLGSGGLDASCKSPCSAVIRYYVGEDSLTQSVQSLQDFVGAHKSISGIIIERVIDDDFIMKTTDESLYFQVTADVPKYLRMTLSSETIMGGNSGAYLNIQSLRVVYRDTDKDGVPDKDDACPAQLGIKEFNGCPEPTNGCISDADCAYLATKGYKAKCVSSDCVLVQSNNWVYFIVIGSVLLIIAVIALVYFKPKLFLLLFSTLILVACTKTSTISDPCIKEFKGCYESVAECQMNCSNVYTSYKEVADKLAKPDFSADRENLLRSQDCLKTCDTDKLECNTMKETCINKIVAEE